MPVCTPSASSSPIPFCTTTIAMVRNNVLRNAPSAWSSWKSCSKFSSPTNERDSPTPDQSVNAEPAPTMLG